MHRLFSKGNFVLLLVGITLLFQNCAPTSVGYSEAPKADNSVVPTPPPDTSPLNADSVIRGTVTNAVNNHPIKAASVRLRKVETAHELLASMSTDNSGNFRSEALAPGNYFVDYVAEGFISVTNVQVVVEKSKEVILNQSMSTAVQSGQMRIVLNWSDPKAGAVEDVDAYMLYPGSTLPIYFNGPNGDGCLLDIDVRLWKGPETITISQMKQGTYRYYVNNYSSPLDRSALGKSEVKVAVYKGSELHKMYTVPMGFGITYEVFRIENGNVVDVKKFNDSLPVAE